MTPERPAPLGTPPDDAPRLARLEQDNRRLRGQVAALIPALARLQRQQAELDRWRAQQLAREASAPWRAGRALAVLVGRVAPPNTLRGHIAAAGQRLGLALIERADLFGQTWEAADLGLALASLAPGAPFVRQRWFVPGAVAARPPSAPGADAGGGVDVVICVHNALPDVQRCLSAVVRNTRSPCRLILVDDGSDAECAGYLATWAREQAAGLIRNETAQGYTRAANQGLRQSTAPWVVLLNSDTLPTPDWLERLLACARSDPRLGLVGPLSNTASWQSIPELFDAAGDWAGNPLPPDLSPDDWAYGLAQSSARLYPRLPLLNGFCLLVRRAALDAVGLFDEEHFGAGYGEENDYCLRARARGWQLALADDAYVYHAQSKSYSDERRKQLSEQAQERLAAKHGLPLIAQSVERLRRDRVLAGLRARARVWPLREQLRVQGRARWEGRRLLCLLPVRGAGGGANVVLQEAEAMRAMGVDVTLATLSELRPEFERGYPDLSFPVCYLEQASDLLALAPRYDACLATHNMSVEWMGWPDTGGPVRGYYVQDFEPWFFPDGSDAQAQARRSYTLFPDLVRLTKTAWTRATVAQQLGVDCQVVGPSVDLERHQPRPRRDGDWPARPLRLAAMIRPESPRRQPGFTMEVLRAVAHQFGRQVQIILFGCSAHDPRFRDLPRDFRWHNAGVLTRAQVAFLLNEVDIFADFSAYQAMGLTALEAMASGVAVVVPQTGGADSFACSGQNSLVVDATSRAAAQQALASLVTDHDLRLQLQRTAIADSANYFPEQAATRVLAALFPASGA
jgi:GT2 family glycosyltransferase